ncbi:MAG TPA: hypothetical protein VFV31_04695, partial [Chitinophagaceae bacterium]|nr:hypothetical protein [Chitinophagaceae bacterium]
MNFSIYKKAKNTWLLGIACISLLVIFNSCEREAVQTLPQREWQLVWSDDFNGTAGSAPDNSKWVFDLGGGGWGNSELQTYTNNAN